MFTLVYDKKVVANEVYEVDKKDGCRCNTVCDTRGDDEEASHRNRGNFSSIVLKLLDSKLREPQATSISQIIVVTHHASGNTRNTSSRCLQIRSIE